MDEDHRARGRIRTEPTPALSRGRPAGLIAIVALTPDGRVPVVRQYRPALERFTWELPAGLVDHGEAAAEALPARTNGGNRLSRQSRPCARHLFALHCVVRTGCIPFCRDRPATERGQTEAGIELKLVSPGKLAQDRYFRGSLRCSFILAPLCSPGCGHPDLTLGALPQGSVRFYSRRTVTFDPDHQPLPESHNLASTSPLERSKKG